MFVSVQDFLCSYSCVESFFDHSVKVGSKVPVNNEHSVAAGVNSPEPQVSCDVIYFGVDVKQPKSDFQGNRLLLG